MYTVLLSADTGDFKIDTSGTYHGMTLKSMTVSQYTRTIRTLVTQTTLVLKTQR